MNNHWFLSDHQFHQLFAEKFHAQASMHWTPLRIVQKAAEFLAATSQAKILDIGSGAGKFCLAAAFYQPQCFYTGVEQRSELVTAANSAANQLNLSKVNFIHCNILEIDFSNYDHFYFFNPFHENIDPSYAIDEHTVANPDLSDSAGVSRYHQYHRYVYKQLNKKPAGTRLVTFHSAENEVPDAFQVVWASEDDTLKFWEKLESH